MSTSPLQLRPEHVARLDEILDRMLEITQRDWFAGQAEFMQLQAELNLLVPPGIEWRWQSAAAFDRVRGVH
jgi:hypothetical protein